jgi:hypothetical protein
LAASELAPKGQRLDVSRIERDRLVRRLDRTGGIAVGTAETGEGEPCPVIAGSRGKRGIEFGGRAGIVAEAGQRGAAYPGRIDSVGWPGMRRLVDRPLILPQQEQGMSHQMARVGGGSSELPRPFDLCLGRTAFPEG